VKKRLALVLAGAAAMSTLGLFAAHADVVNTPIGNANVDPASGVTLDGNSQNPDPLDGYLILHADGTVSCGDEGGPYNDDGSVNDEFEDPGTCNPTLPAL